MGSWGKIMKGLNVTLRLKALGGAVLLLAIALSGCGFGGSNDNSSSGNSTGTGSSSGGGSTSATYVYVADAADAGGAFGWKLDSGGNLTSVAGSPFLLPTGGNLQGALAASNGFVYVVNRPVETGGAAIHTFKADASSGALSQVGNPVIFTSPSDSDVRHLVVAPSGNTAYASTQFNVIAIALNNGSPMALNTQLGSDGEVFGVAAGSRFVFAGGVNGNPKSGFQTPVIKRFAIGTDGSLGTGQVVATLSDANIPRGLALDASGKFLAATTGLNNGSVTAFNVAVDGSLTPVGTVSTNGKNGQTLAFDSSAKFLYLLTSEEPVPNQESVLVYSVGTSGALTLVQTFDLPSGVRNAGFKVLDNFVIVVNDTLGGVESSVTVLHRDATTGQLSAGSTISGTKPLGQVDTLSF